MVSSKQFFVERCTRSEAAAILKPYHYLSRISKGFRCGVNYGLFAGSSDDLLLTSPVGVCIFTCLPVPEIAVGAFGLERTDQDGLFELSRLCLCPSVQSSEHNLSSWFIARCIKRLTLDAKVRAIISYADSAFHSGTVYAATGFSYCGLSDSKFDYIGLDGRPLSRGSSDIGTVDRTRKHRFVKLFDPDLRLLWPIKRWARGDTNATADN